VALLTRRCLDPAQYLLKIYIALIPISIAKLIVRTIQDVVGVLALLPQYRSFQYVTFPQNFSSLKFPSLVFTCLYPFCYISCPTFEWYKNSPTSFSPFLLELLTSQLGCNKTPTLRGVGPAEYSSYTFPLPPSIASEIALCLFDSILCRTLFVESSTRSSHGSIILSLLRERRPTRNSLVHSFDFTGLRGF